jgi:drug/metabolite transporter (DMT)-like permease
VPIIAVVLTRLIGEAERLSVKRTAGLALGFAGVAVLVWPELGGGEPRAIVEVLLVALAYATAPLIADRWLHDVPGLPMTAVCLAAAALLYTTPAVLTWPDAVPAAPVLAAVTGLAVVCTAIALLIFLALIREVGPSRALVITYVNPAVAVVAGVAVLGEPLTATIIAAFALILTGSVLATARPKGGGHGDADPAREGAVAA